LAWTAGSLPWSAAVGNLPAGGRNRQAGFAWRRLADAAACPADPTGASSQSGDKRSKQLQAADLGRWCAPRGMRTPNRQIRRLVVYVLMGVWQYPLVFMTRHGTLCAPSGKCVTPHGEMWEWRQSRINLPPTIYLPAGSGRPHSLRLSFAGVRAWPRREAGGTPCIAKRGGRTCGAMVQPLWQVRLA
jgi:hypothetical protein